MEILQTDRLILRSFQPDDLDEFARIDADPDVMKYYASGPRSRETSARAIAWYLELQETRGHSFWAVIQKADRQFIGLCGLIPQWIEGVEEIELAYRFARNAWGQGFATEAAMAVRQWAFDNLPVPRLISIIDPRNTASMRVAEKNGMVPVQEAEYDGKICRIYAIDRLL